MTKNFRAGLLAAVLFLPAAFAQTLAAATPEEEKATLAAAEKLLAQDPEKKVDVPACGALAERLAALPGPPAALARMQVLARCLQSVDYENREQPAVVALIAKLGDEVIYSEPSGQYYVSRQRIWDVYEKFKTHPLAEDLAWEAARTPAGGECEGFLNCQLYDSLDSMGRYLELYPQGEHVAAALEELYWLQEEPSGVEPLEKSDRAQAKEMLARWRKILGAVPGGKEKLKGVDMIAAAYKVK